MLVTSSTVAALDLFFCLSNAHLRFGACVGVGGALALVRWWSHLLLMVQVEREHRIHGGPRPSMVLAVASAVQCWLPVPTMGRRASNPIIVPDHNCSLFDRNCSLRLVVFLVFAITFTHNTLQLGTIARSAHRSFVWFE
jgi:hypothetical protein